MCGCMHGIDNPDERVADSAQIIKCVAVSMLFCKVCSCTHRLHICAFMMHGSEDVGRPCSAFMRTL
jgi:hypothetical protein